MNLCSFNKFELSSRRLLTVDKCKPFFVIRFVCLILIHITPFTTRAAVHCSEVFSKEDLSYKQQNYRRIFFESEREKQSYSSHPVHLPNPESLPSWVFSEPKTSTVARKLGTKIYHNTFTLGREGLIGILISGQIGRPVPNEPVTDYQLRNRRYDFKYAEIRSAPKNFDIELDMHILDRKDYYINDGHNYGEYGLSSIRFDQPSLLRSFIYDRTKDFRLNELVFWAPIPTSMIKKIFVRSDIRESIIQELKSLGASPPSGKTWEDLFD